MRNRDALVIRTPEGIEFSLPLAGPFSRMLALVIDIAVIIMLGSFLEKVLAPLLVFGQDLADALAVIGYFVISDLQRGAGEARPSASVCCACAWWTRAVSGLSRARWSSAT